MAETKYKKGLSGAERVLKKKYLYLKKRDNLKKMYHKMDRIDYLSQIGNIVMHIQLIKGQMCEIRDTRQNKNQASNEDPNAVYDSMEDSDDGFSGVVGIDGDHSDVFNSTGAYETLSIEEENHPYVGRVIGKAVLNGKKAKEFR